MLLANTSHTDNCFVPSARVPMLASSARVRYFMKSKECTKCKQTKSISDFNTRLGGYRSECKKCQYATQYERERRERVKINAKHTARLATKKGKLQKPFLCEICNQVKPLERHHPDYGKPLKIVWVCRKCHGVLTAKKCSIIGCERKHQAKGFCGKHYMMNKRHHRILQFSSLYGRAAPSPPGPPVV